MAGEKDRRLEEKIQYMLDTHKEFKGYGLKADVEDGKVLLSGIVDTLADSNRAEKMISQVEGVQGLDNGLAISTDGTITDPGVFMEAAEELEADPGVNTRDVGVGDVEDGRVHLRGHTGSVDEVNAAEQAASRARGARDVVNEVEVNTGEYDTGDPEEIFHHQVNNDRDE